MKIQTNLRAGAGQKRKSSTDSTSVETVSVPVVPVSRCAGI
ncbi:hypothetical protein [Rhodoferax lacus]|nr:hypothetical protein [Rhodoferax lacus]